MNKELTKVELFKLQKGEYLGSFPYGYKTIKLDKKPKYSTPAKIYIDEFEANLVKDIFNTYVIGKYSTLDITEYIHKKYNITKPNKSTIQKILRNKFYIGIMTWRGKEFKHCYPTFINKDIFVKVQEILDFHYVHRFDHRRYSDFHQQFTIKEIKSDPVLDLFKQAISIDELIKETGFTILQVHNLILELQLDNKINEILPGLWKLK